MMPELDGLAHRVVAALCNGVYQGVLFTLVVALVLRISAGPTPPRATCSH